MSKRLWAISRALPLVFLAAVFAGCQEKQPGVNQYVLGTPDLKVVDSRFVSFPEAAGSTVGGSQQGYALVKVSFTNHITDQLFPQVNHFVLTFIDGSRFTAVDSGSSAFVGVSNDWSAMKRDETRDFTIGFRISALAYGGQVAYEP
ncbi:MAG: hypothetical protein JO293_04790 [Candidatus Eremiobacteraeota bacterium]|nr:hypothetical protein [Candidatus Eremiobacteraeota bacterium]